MALDWETASVRRKNRYLDWQVQNRSANGRRERDRWCPVLVEVKKDEGIYHANLKALLELASDNSADFQLRMTADELELLKSLISDINDGAPEPDEPVGVWFFVYLRESSVYEDDGTFAHTGLYTIVFVGPPIPTLEFGLIQLGGKPTAIPPATGLLPPTAVGIIDDGIAFAHERFRTSTNGTRIQAIWLQTIERVTGDNGVAFGKRIEWEELDGNLRSGIREEEIYRKAGLLDFGAKDHKPHAYRASHGTHVLDLAAGFDPAEIGDALQRPIFAVQLPSEATADTSGIRMGSYVLQGIRQIMLWADRMGKTVPLVINFSYGIHAGPKDGTHELERIIDRLVAYRSKSAPTRLVLPSGNNYRNRDTARMTFSNDETQNIGWMIQPDDPSPNYLEIWLDVNPGGVAAPAAPVELQLRTPDGLADPGTLPADGRVKVLMQDGKPAAAVYYDHVPGSNGNPERGRVFIAVNPTHYLAREVTAARDPGEEVNFAPAGRWEISLKRSVRSDVTATLFIQRDDTPASYPRRNRQSYFEHQHAYDRDEFGDYTSLNPEGPVTHEFTVSAIASGNVPIIVGAAEASHGFPPSDYTASGPAMTRKVIPALSAVADEGTEHRGLIAAGTFSGSSVALRGTSIAAPQVVRCMAYQLTPDRWDDICKHVPCWSPRKGDEPRLGTCILKPADAPRVPGRRYPSN